MNPRSQSPRPLWIDDAGRLEAVGRQLAGAPAIGLDTEQDSFFSYRTKVCLIQIHAHGRDWIVDALALDDFTPLRAPFTDPRVPKILHAADNDVDLLRRDCGLEIRGLFDTMAAASILGRRKTGLASLIEEHFGVRLDKRHQRSDWRRRPLTADQIEYAALDVRHLPELMAILRRDLERLGRVEESQAEFARIERIAREPKRFDPDHYYRLAGAHGLDGLGRRVLRELFRFREEIAEREDRALFRVCSDAVLVEMASRAPRGQRSADWLRRIRGLPDSWKERHGGRVMQVIGEALAQGELAPPPRPRADEPGTRLQDAERALFDALREWRARRAARRDVEPGRVVPNAMLLELVRRRAASAADLAAAGFEAWRIREYGGELLEVLRRGPARGRRRG